MFPKSMSKAVFVLTFIAPLLALLPAGAAQGHGKLPLGRYDYYYTSSWGLTYGYEDLRIRPDHRYTWNDAGVAYRGRYRHPSDPALKRVRFITGKLSTMDVTGRHDRVNGHKIILRWDTGASFVDQFFYLQS